MLLIALLMSACGGGSSGSSGGGGGGTSSYSIGGAVTGLASGASLVLQDNAGDNLTVTAIGSFTFATKIAGGASYAVTVLTQPTNQTCAVTAGSGTASANVTGVSVACTTKMVSVPNVVGTTQAGAATAIAGAGLTLGTITMQSSTTVVSGNVISESPAAGTSVSSGSAVALVVSTGAVASTPTLSGIVIGLSSGMTVHVLNGADNVPVGANGGFTFPTALTAGLSYSVSVGAPQPTGQTCAVQNGAGTAASANITNVVVNCTINVTAATLSGAYTGVSVAIDAHADTLHALGFDGVGSFTDSITNNANGIVTTGSIPGTYAVAPVNSIPSLTVNGGAVVGAIELNASAAVVLTNATGGSPPGMLVAVKQAQNASASSVNGTYALASLESTNPPSASMATATLNSGTATVSAVQRNTNGVLSTQSGSTEPYSVTASGAVTLGAGGLGISGAVSADGDLATLGPITTNGNGSTRGIYVAVKQGSGVVAATFNGIYTMVSLSTTSSVTATDGRVYTVDVADGSFGGAYDENDAGTASTNHLVAGTYTLAADGTLQWAFKGGASMTGTLSADGNVFVLTDLTSGEAPTLLVGVRQ